MCSATAMLVRRRCVLTLMPRRAQAARSTLSARVPNLWMNFRRGANASSASPIAMLSTTSASAAAAPPAIRLCRFDKTHVGRKHRRAGAPAPPRSRPSDRYRARRSRRTPPCVRRTWPGSSRPAENAAPCRPRLRSPARRRAFHSRIYCRRSRKQQARQRPRARRQLRRHRRQAASLQENLLKRWNPGRETRTIRPAALSGTLCSMISRVIRRPAVHGGL